MRPVCLWGEVYVSHPDIINQEGLVRFQRALFHALQGNQAIVKKNVHTEGPNVIELHLDT